MSFYVKALGFITGAVTTIYFLRKVRKIFLNTIPKEKELNVLSNSLYTKYMKIPRGAISQILGRHGSNVRQLEFETKKTISAIKNLNPTIEWETKFAEEEENWDKQKKELSKADQFAFLKIQGKTLESIELAICKVKAIISDWKRNSHVDQISIPNDAVGFVIGKNGKNLKNICHICHVKANIVSSNEMHNIMEIKGTEEGVQAAHERFQTSISRFYQIRGEVEEIVTEFAPDPIDERGIYADIEEELAELQKLRQILQENTWE